MMPTHTVLVILASGTLFHHIPYMLNLSSSLCRKLHSLSHAQCITHHSATENLFIYQSRNDLSMHAFDKWFWLVMICHSIEGSKVCEKTKPNNSKTSESDKESEHFELSVSSKLVNWPLPDISDCATQSVFAFRGNSKDRIFYYFKLSSVVKADVLHFRRLGPSS